MPPMLMSHFISLLPPMGLAHGYPLWGRERGREREGLLPRLGLRMCLSRRCKTFGYRFTYFPISAATIVVRAWFRVCGFFMCIIQQRRVPKHRCPATRVLSFAVCNSSGACISGVIHAHETRQRMYKIFAGKSDRCIRPPIIPGL